MLERSLTVADEIGCFFLHERQGQTQEGVLLSYAWESSRSDTGDVMHAVKRRGGYERQSGASMADASASMVNR